MVVNFYNIGRWAHTNVKLHFLVSASLAKKVIFMYLETFRGHNLHYIILSTWQLSNISLY